MNSKTRGQILDHMPPYHDLPWKLTVREISNPELVVKSFFESYKLSEIREFLNYWEDQALRSKDVNHDDIRSVHFDVVRLIEAVSLLKESGCDVSPIADGQ